MESSLLGKPELSLDRVFTHKSEHFTGGQTDEFDQREWVMEITPFPVEHLPEWGWPQPTYLDSVDPNWIWARHPDGVYRQEERYKHPAASPKSQLAVAAAAG